MRNLPFAVDGIPVKPSAEVVIDPAGRHRPQLKQRVPFQSPVLLPRRLPQHQAQRRDRRKFRTVAKSPVHRIEQSSQFADRVIQQPVRQGLRRQLWRADSQQPLFDPGNIFLNFVAMIPIGFDDAPQDVRKGRQVVPRHRRKVGPSVERFLIRRQKHGQGPAASASGKDLGRLLVDLVEVRALFAIHFDVDEMPIHHPGDFEVLKRFMRHHVAPMAGGIADRQENRPVFGLRPRQRLLAPGIPVHGIFGVLPEIGTRLGKQTIGQCVAR